MASLRQKIASGRGSLESTNSRAARNLLVMQSPFQINCFHLEPEAEASAAATAQQALFRVVVAFRPRQNGDAAMPLLE